MQTLEELKKVIPSSPPPSSSVITPVKPQKKLANEQIIEEIETLCRGYMEKLKTEFARDKDSYTALNGKPIPNKPWINDAVSKYMAVDKMLQHLKVKEEIPLEYRIASFKTELEGMKDVLSTKRDTSGGWTWLFKCLDKVSNWLKNRPTSGADLVAKVEEKSKQLPDIEPPKPN